MVNYANTETKCAALSMLAEITLCTTLQTASGQYVGLTEHRIGNRRIRNTHGEPTMDSRAAMAAAEAFAGSLEGREFEQLPNGKIREI